MIAGPDPLFRDCYLQWMAQLQRVEPSARGPVARVARLRGFRASRRPKLTPLSPHDAGSGWRPQQIDPCICKPPGLGLRDARYAKLEELVFCYAQARERAPRTAIFPGDGECCANQSCPAVSILNGEVLLDIDFNTDPLPQTQDVSPRLLELRLDEGRLWVVGNRLLAVVVDVDGTYQVSLLVAGAVAQSRSDAPVVAETDALGARDLFRKGEIENRHWPLYRRLGGGARHCRKEGDQNDAHNASYCWHLPVVLNEVSWDELGRNKGNTCDT